MNPARARIGSAKRIFIVLLSQNIIESECSCKYYPLGGITAGMTRTKLFVVMTLLSGLLKGDAIVYGPGEMLGVSVDAQSIDTLNGQLARNDSLALGFTVTSAADVTLSISTVFGPLLNDCVFGDSGYCSGNVNDYATLSGPSSGSASFGGTYTYTTAGDPDNVGPICDYQANFSCEVFLQPGSYTINATVWDYLEGQNGATVLPFDETFGAGLTVNSGSLQVGSTDAPEPSSFVPLLLVGLVYCVKRQFKA